MSIKKVIIIVSFLVVLNLILLSSIFAQKGEWVEASGRASVHATVPEAIEQARINALGKALNKACGTTVKGLSTIKDGSLLSSIMTFENLGTLIDETKLKPDKIENATDRADLPPAVICQSWYKFKIVCSAQKFDATFILDLKLNGVNFIEKEDLIISVESSKLCHLYLFCMASNDECYLLYPNSYHNNNALAANTKIQIPNKSEREGILNMKFELYTGKDLYRQHKAYATETIVAVVTKDQIPILSLGEEFDFNSNITIRKMKVTDFGKWLTKIPVKVSRLHPLWEFNIPTSYSQNITPINNKNWSNGNKPWRISRINIYTNIQIIP